MQKIMLIILTALQTIFMYGGGHSEAKQSTHNPPVRFPLSHYKVKYRVNTMRDDQALASQKKIEKHVHFNAVIGSQLVIENHRDRVENQ